MKSILKIAARFVQDLWSYATDDTSHITTPTTQFYNEKFGILACMTREDQNSFEVDQNLLTNSLPDVMAQKPDILIAEMKMRNERGGLYGPTYTSMIAEKHYIGMKDKDDNHKLVPFKNIVEKWRNNQVFTLDQNIMPFDEISDVRLRYFKNIDAQDNNVIKNGAIVITYKAL